MPKNKEEMIKATLRLPEAIWKKARIQALEEKTSFQEIVKKALELYLSKPKKGGKKK